ncbi:MAG: Crp/Fnr family transcriptional regulator [Clostridia bacterium]|nr:Crp/Fnr family transcriptional regulator [Clostridia bacterium]
MKEVLEILDSLPITKGADAKCLLEAANVSSPNFVKIDRGEIILSPGQIEDALYVLCDGSAVAYSADEDKQVLLRTFVPFEIFGISNLYTNLPFATRIVAKSDCRILVLHKSFLSYLIDHDSRVRYQYISFLAQKTLYLNQKISYLTAGSAEQRLAYWLDSNACGDTVMIQIPMNALCTMLDIGRASLYRAFDKLERDGFILRQQKTVRLIDRDRMLHNYK